MKNPLEDLPLQIATTVLLLIDEHQFEPPITVVAVGANGAMIALRYFPDENSIGEPVYIAEALPEEGLQIPVSLMFVSANSGKAKLSTIQTGKVDDGLPLQ